MEKDWVDHDSNNGLLVQDVDNAMTLKERRDLLMDDKPKAGLSIGQCCCDSDETRLQIKRKQDDDGNSLIDVFNKIRTTHHTVTENSEGYTIARYFARIHKLSHKRDLTNHTCIRVRYPTMDNTVGPTYLYH